MSITRRTASTTVLALLAGLVLSIVPASQASAATVVHLVAKNPVKAGASIRHDGWMNVAPAKSISITVYGQRKVCGFWGCNWHNKAKRSVGKAFVRSTGLVRVHQPCVRGTHRYRTYSQGFVREPWGTGTSSKLSTGILFRC